MTNSHPHSRTVRGLAKSMDNALVTWLENHLSTLTEAAARRLAQSEALRATVTESTEAFFDGLIRTLRLESEIPLNLILLDWVEARSAPTEDDELSGLLPILNTLKEVVWQAVCEQVAEPVQLAEWLTTLDRVFTEATRYLVKLETDALVQDTRAELSRALLDIERLNKSKSDFISVAAHELKTPLTLVEGYSNMLRGVVSPEQSAGIAEILDGIEAGTSRLREIIQDMIDVSLIEMDLLVLHEQPVWLNRLVEAVEYDLQKLLRTRNLNVKIDKASLPTTPTFGDPERLHQALMKVVTNAVKYTPDGRSLSIYSRKLPGFTEIVVEDTGIGIDPDDLIRIFEKFSSLGDLALHSSGKTKFKGGGPGLGLAIAKGIIEAHGGTIWAESPGYDEEKLPGSAFHIMIPMKTPPASNAMAALFSTPESN